MSEEDTKREKLNKELEDLRGQKNALIEEVKGLEKEKGNAEDLLSKQKKENQKKLTAWHDEMSKSLENKLTTKTKEERTKIDQDLTNERKKRFAELDGEIADTRGKRIKALEEEIESERKQRLKQLKSECDEERKELKAEIKTQKDEFKKECEESRKELKAEIEAKEQACRKECDEERKELESQKESLDEDKIKLVAIRAEVDSKSSENDYREHMLKAKEEAFLTNKEVFEHHLDERVKERRKDFDKQQETLQAECERLRESLSLSTESIGVHEELKRRLGEEDPAAILLKLNGQEQELSKLHKELLDRPTKKMLETHKIIEKENGRLETKLESLSEEVGSLRDNAEKVDKHKFKASELLLQNKSLDSRVKSLGAECERLQSELERLHSAYKRTEAREDRIKDIERPYLNEPPAVMSSAKKVDELEWLNGIHKSCVDYGLRFPKRILYSFHTALKTAEWSPLTVLSGVSGTGKSQLPELYSHFGGLNFMSLAVQPNWDSQESMLGFFNSIDNKFDAQPVLRLLAQSQKKREDDYPGLEDAMTIILMDEMNLAHVELYFSEFLSKLELRRGLSPNQVPELEVKLGAGIEPYPLPLGRNVLWTGTMNQDETTKSLSDKVVDRGIIIHFPRPLELQRREKLKPKGDPVPLLSRKQWHKWWAKEITIPLEIITPYKSFVEKINHSLEKVGRAIGHRVWQSIEYYMQNYPTVRASSAGDESDLKKALDTAFEDQIVQKIMPKLMGIETRTGSTSRNCLDNIRSQIAERHEALVEDFDSACEFGHGVFLWNSASYLREQPEEHLTEEEEEKKYSVVLTKVGPKTKVCRVFQNRRKMNLQEAKEAVEGILAKDSSEHVVLTKVPKAEAEAVMKDFQDAECEAMLREE